MMRNRILRAAFVAATIAAAPAALAAQQPTGGTAMPATHTVVTGETLWSLAQRYLSDPHRWPEIYDLNKSAIADPHWIYPGQVLKLPGAVTSVAVSVAPAPAPAPATPVAARPADTAARAPAAPAVNPAMAPTVFRRPPAVVRTPVALNLQGPEIPTVLSGEYLRAPFVVKPGEIAGGGRLLKSGDLDPQGAVDTRSIFKAYDDVMIQPPAGVAAQKGDRYVALQMGKTLPGGGQVAIPTGVLEVTRPAAAGVAAMAQVVQLFGEMNPGQAIVPLDTAGLSSVTRPQPVENGRWATIQWVLASPVLPTLQNYAVLNLTTADGVKTGDEFIVYRPRTESEVRGRPGDPEIPIGRAQAIRVTPFGTTAIVTAQEQPAINVGSAVRLSAKMP
jgi:hypothetical protein